jgi:CheY-like chemotaxis protein
MELNPEVKPQSHLLLTQPAVWCSIESDMPRARLIHWNASEAEQYMRLLIEAGWEVSYEPAIASGFLVRLRESRPDVIIIDLSRLPSHGREVAGAVRASKCTRHIPLVFVEGKADKVQAIRDSLPDAVYGGWAEIHTLLHQASHQAPAEPTVPVPHMQRYAGRPVAQKLGLKAGMKVNAIDAPRDYLHPLTGAAANVEFLEDAAEPCEVTLCFVRDLGSLHERLPELRRIVDQSRLWVLWPKQKASKRSGVTEKAIRESAIALGMVDYKICSYDATWSAIALARKRTAAATH